MPSSQGKGARGRHLGSPWPAHAAFPNQAPVPTEGTVSRPPISPRAHIARPPRRVRTPASRFSTKWTIQSVRMVQRTNWVSATSTSTRTEANAAASWGMPPPINLRKASLGQRARLRTEWRRKGQRMGGGGHKQFCPRRSHVNPPTARPTRCSWLGGVARRIMALPLVILTVCPAVPPAKGSVAHLSLLCGPKSGAAGADLPSSSPLSPPQPSGPTRCGHRPIGTSAKRGSAKGRHPSVTGLGQSREKPACPTRLKSKLTT